MKNKIKLISAVMFLVAFSTGLCFSQGVKLTKVAELGSGLYQGIAVRGNYAYCAASAAGLDILDISTPSKPVKVANIEVNRDAYDVVLSGNYAYVVNSKVDTIYTYITILNISSRLPPAFWDRAAPCPYGKKSGSMFPTRLTWFSPVRTMTREYSRRS